MRLVHLHWSHTRKNAYIIMEEMVNPLLHIYTVTTMVTSLDPDQPAYLCHLNWILVTMFASWSEITQYI
jgi:hypothetical protein